MKTKRQYISRQRLFIYIKNFHYLNYRMPTHKEIFYDLKISRGSAIRMYKLLIKEGKLEPLPIGMIPYRISGS